MFNLRKRVLEVFTQPKRKLKVLMPKLKKFRLSIDMMVTFRADPLHALVYFLDVTSIWHDRGLKDIIDAFRAVNYGQHERLLTELKKLERYIEDAGRSTHGINRTRRGEKVTAKRVFLGNRFGLNTLSVTKWEKSQYSPKGGWAYPHMEDLNSYDVVSRQALEFMEYRIPTIVNILKYLESYVT